MESERYGLPANADSPVQENVVPATLARAKGELDQLLVGAELDRVGRAGLRALWLQSVLTAVITERSLAGAPVLGVAIDHTEWTRGHAVAAAVTHVGLKHHRLMLGAD